MSEKLTKTEKKQVEQAMSDMLFELLEEAFITNDSSVTYANAWDYKPTIELPQNFQCGGVNNAGMFLKVADDGYVRLTAVEPGTGVTQEYVDRQDQSVLDTMTQRFEEGAEQLTQLINQEAETRSERDNALLENINHLGERVTDIERQEDAWNAKSTVSVSPTGTATHEISYITVNNEEYKIAGGSSTQQQSDWAQTDTTAVDYIKNKPTNLVTTDEAQKITGAKDFTGALTQNNDPVVTSSMLTNYATTTQLDNEANTRSQADALLKNQIDTLAEEKVSTLTASDVNYPSCNAVINYINNLNGDNDQF